MKPYQENVPLNILLADDDRDDRELFARALKEIDVYSNLVTVSNGEDLMLYLLNNTATIPDVLFLDLSMPRKTGFESLIEIKENKNLETIPVIIFTTSFIRSDIESEIKLSNMLFNMGACEYFRKPSGFDQLKYILHQTLIKTINNKALMSSK